ncbi:MAG: helix-turn-helix transcriptional regulator [Alphaproteobacteria bacterium]|nr:helix-turn-helix transcriptional regulator [Alphaproteobacteria bacterium]
MAIDTTSFGSAIASARKELELSQKEVAKKIRKEDGETITPQYLNDIEHDRRSPSSDHIVKQFASVLKIPADILYWLAGRVPGDVTNRTVSPEQIEKAYAVFRKTIKGK